MNTQILLFVAAVAVALVVLKAVLRKKPAPPTRTFRCARCSAVEEYGPRTIEAWRKGIKRLYCRSCHHAWINTRSPDPKHMRAAPAKAPGGCAPVVLLGAFLPAAIYAASKFIS